MKDMQVLSGTAHPEYWLFLFPDFPFTTLKIFGDCEGRSLMGKLHHY
jgi:hypothetical protein